MASSTDSPDLIDFSDTTAASSSPPETMANVQPPRHTAGGLLPNTGRHRWPRHSVVDETVTLEPDHPLMKRFQASLKAHLERLNLRLNEEVLELEALFKLKQKDREQLGSLLFGVQQEVGRQQTRIDEYSGTLSSLLEMRDEMEGLVAESKGKLKAEKDKLNAELRKETELRGDLEKLLALQRQFEAWAEDTEAELTVSQRISEKTRLEKKQRTMEKRQQDMLISRMMTDVSRLTTDLKVVEEQFTMKEHERNVLCETLIDADADLEVLGSEHGRLVQAWRGVVLTTQQRDTHYTDLQNKLDELRTEFQTVCASIGALKRAASKEQERHEELTLVLHRIHSETSEVERVLGVDNARRAWLEEQLMETAAVLQLTDDDVARMQAMIMQRETESKILAKELDKLYTEKVHTEDSIVALLQDKTMNDKAANYMSKLVTQSRDKTQHQELILVGMENALSTSMLDVEEQESSNQSNRLLYDELKKEQDKQEKVLDQLTSALKQRVLAAAKRQTGIDSLNKKLEHMVSQSGGVEASPLELKILNLERSIQETHQKTEKLKPYWLRQEGLIVQLSQQRNQQLYNINILHKQVSVLDQKNVKTEYEIDRQTKAEQAVNRSVASLLNRLVALNTERCQTQGYQEILDKDNHLKHSQFLHTLKEAELASLQLEAENAQLVEERQQLSEQLIGTQRENLVWEKKVQMAVEAKQTLDREMRADGDLGCMKAEIHRMQVRESQLRRVQDRLIADLEHCVSRREAIVDTAEAKQRRAAKATGTRKHFHKQLEDLSNKIRQSATKCQSAEAEISSLQQQQQELMGQLEQKQQDVRLLKEAKAQVDLQVEDAVLHKQKNLEQLVRRQRKVRNYGNIKQFTYRLLYKSPAALEAETSKQQVMHADLISIVEALLGDFPDLRLDINRVLNTLRLQPS